MALNVVSEDFNLEQSVSTWNVLVRQQQKECLIFRRFDALRAREESKMSTINHCLDTTDTIRHAARIMVFGPKDTETLRRRLAARERRVVDVPDMPRAAVLVPLLTEGDEWRLLFSKRTDSVGTHQGQVAFPGGHVEDGDADLLETALREAEEEIGLRPSNVDVLGLGDDVIAISDVQVTPVVGRILEPFETRLEPNEVDYTFSLSLEHLSDPASHPGFYSRETFLGKLDFPIYQGGPAPVWGLTAWIVTEMLPLLSH